MIFPSKKPPQKNHLPKKKKKGENGSAIQRLKNGMRMFSAAPVSREKPPDHYKHHMALWWMDF